MISPIPMPEDVLSVTHAIQQAVAPVFLLTGVGGLLAVLTNRLGRIIDRIRIIDHMEEVGRLENAIERDLLQRRARLIHWAIILCAAGALFVCLVTAALFVGSQFSWDPSATISLFFIATMVAMILGLLCFLREIALAMSFVRVQPKTKKRYDNP